MASLAEQIVLSIQAVVSGQQQVTSLTGSLNGLSQATQNLNGHFVDVNGRLRDAQGRFAAAGSAAGAMAGGFVGAAAGAGRLNLGLLNLNAGLQIVQQVQQAVQGLMNQMGKYAQQADGAAVAARSWQIVLERFNIDAGKAEAAMASLSDRTGASVESLKSAAAQYIKMGGTLEDFERATLAAASSWYDLAQKTITLDDAINNVTLGVATGRSELMETANIVVNASQAWERYADSLGKSVDDLTDAEKAHAYALAVYKEEQIGIETLADKQTDLSRAQNEASKAQREFVNAAGQVVLPLYTQMVRAGTDVTRAVTEMVRAYREGGSATEELARKNPALITALERVRPAVDRMRDGLLNAWEGIQEFAQRTLFPLFESVAPIVQRAWAQVPGIVQSAGQLIGETFRLIADLWARYGQPTFDAVAPIVSAAFDAVGRVLRGAVDFIRGVVTTVRALFAGDWKGAWDTAVNTVGHALLAVEDVLKGLIPAVGRVVKGVHDSLTEAGTQWGLKAKAAGLRVKDNIIAGLAGLAERLATEVGAALDRATSLQGYLEGVAEAASGAGAAAGARTREREAVASGRFGSLQQILAGLGITGTALSQGFGANPNRFGYGPAGHRGLDYAAPQGTPIYAPTGARVTYGYEKDGYGQYLKLIGSQGKQMILAHLSGISTALLNEMKANNGWATVTAGEFLGKTGGMKGLKSSGNSTGPHLHIELRDASGKVLNPGGAVPVPVTSTPKATASAPKPTGGGTPPPPPPAAPSAEDVRKSVEARIRDILARVDLQLISKDAAIKLLSEIDREATATARKQGKGWQEYAATAKTAQSAIEGLKKTGAGLKETKDVLGALATQYEYAGKTGLPAYVNGLRAFIAQQEKAAASAKKGSQEQLDAMANVNRARQMLEDATKPKGPAPISQADMDRYRKGAEEVLRLEKALETSTDPDWRRRAQNRIAAYNAQGEAAQGVLAVLRGVAQREEELDDRRSAREKEQAQLRARLADQQRQFTVNAAQAALSRLQELNRQELAAFKGTAAERQRIVERQARDEYNARERVAAAIRDKAIREAQQGEKQLEAGRIAEANRAYEQALLEAKGARDAAIRAAVEGVQREKQAVSELVGRYREAGQALQEKADAGKLTSDDLSGYLKTLAGLWQQAGQAGLKTNPQIVAAHQAAKALGQAAATTSDRVAELNRRLEESEGANLAAVQGASDLAGELLNMGQPAEALAVLEAALDGVMEAAGRGESVGAAVSFLTNRISKLKDEIADLELKAQAARGAEAMWLAQNPGDVPPVTENVRRDADGGYIFGDTSGWEQGFTDAFQGDTLGEQFRNAVKFIASDVFKEAGQEAKKSFWEEFEWAFGGMDEAALVDLGVDALREILAGLGDDEALKEWRGKVQAALDQAVNTRVTDAGYAALGAVLTQFEALDSRAANYSDTLRDRLLPELERIRDAATDPALKQAAETAIGYLNGEIDAARELARLREEAALSGLDRRRASGQIGEEEYIAERQRLRLEQEEARYRLDIQGKTGKALELAEAQHQRNVAAIIQEGVDAQLALQDRLAEERLSITRRGQERELEARRQAGMPELEYIAERARLAEQAARDEFDARVKGLKKGTPEYLQAEQALQSKIADIRQRAQFEAADSLEGAVKQLQGAARELAQALGETERPYQNQIRLLLELKGRYPELTSQIDELIERYTRLQQISIGLTRFQEQAGYVRDLAAAFAELAGSFGASDLEANLNGIANAAGKAIALAGDVARIMANPYDVGAWVGAITKVVGGIAEALSGFKKAHAEAKRLRESFNEQFTLFRGDDYAKTFVRSRGFFADLFGGGPEVVQEIDKVGLSIAETIADGAMNGMQTGFQKYLETGNMADFAAAMETSIKGAIQKSLIEGFMNSPERMNTYGQAIKNYTDARKSGDPAQIAAATAALIAAYKSDMEAAKAVAEDLKRLQEEAMSPEERARRDAERQRDLDARRLNNAELSLEYQYKAGLMAAEEYERQKLALALDRIRAQMEAELAAEGLSPEEEAVIREKYRLEADLARAEREAQRREEERQRWEEARRAAAQARQEQERVLDSWRQSLLGGVQALLKGESPLDALYSGVRDRIAQAIQEGFVVKRIMARLDPLFQQLDAALVNGLDPSNIIRQIGGALPTLGVQLQTELGPLITLLNSVLPNALNANTRALNGVTDALEQAQFNTTIVTYGQVPSNDGALRLRLGRLA